MVAKAKTGAISLEEKFDATDEEKKEKFELPSDELANEEVDYKVDYRLTKYIKVFDDALPPQYCDKIVKMFREDADHHVVRNSLQETGEKFVSLNIDSNNDEDWGKISTTQRKIVEATMPVYVKSVRPHVNCFPEKSTLEDFYVYQFRDAEDVKETNIDVAKSSQVKRYMTFLWFLTDDEDFQIGFFDVQNTVSAKKGRLIVFPATWTYPYSIGNFSGNENFIIKSHITQV